MRLSVRERNLAHRNCSPELSHIGCIPFLSGQPLLQVCPQNCLLPMKEYDYAVDRDASTLQLILLSATWLYLRIFAPTIVWTMHFCNDLQTVASP
jgi:hypothetical protein